MRWKHYFLLGWLTLSPCFINQPMWHKMRPGLSKLLPLFYLLLVFSFWSQQLVRIIPDNVVPCVPGSTLGSSPYVGCIHFFVCISCISPTHCTLLICIIISKLSSLNSYFTSFSVLFLHRPILLTTLYHWVVIIYA